MKTTKPNQILVEKVIRDYSEQFKKISQISNREVARI